MIYTFTREQHNAVLKVLNMLTEDGSTDIIVSGVLVSIFAFLNFHNRRL